MIAVESEDADERCFEVSVGGSAGFVASIEFDYGSVIGDDSSWYGGTVALPGL